MSTHPHSRSRRSSAQTACGGPSRSAATDPYPEGLWDAHTHIAYWGEDALDSLTKYGVVGVRDLGGNPELLRKWRDEIARGVRRGPRIYYSGRHINGPGRTAPIA